MDNASPTTEPPTPPSGSPSPASGPRVSRDQMKDLGRLRRSVTDRHIAGVAGGIARHLDVDPIIVRVALVVAVFFGGAGLLAYIGAWILVPEEGTDDEPLGLDQRSRSLALARRRRPRAALRRRRLGRRLLVPVAAGDHRGARHLVPQPQGEVARRGAATATSSRRSPASPSRARRRTHRAWTCPPRRATAPTAPRTSPAGRRTPASRAGRATRARRGPILFFFTLALIALAEGVLGVVDLAGAVGGRQRLPGPRPRHHRRDARCSARSGAAPAA